MRKEGGFACLRFVSIKLSYSGTQSAWHNTCSKQLHLQIIAIHKHWGSYCKLVSAGRQSHWQRCTDFTGWGNILKSHHRQQYMRRRVTRDQQCQARLGRWGKLFAGAARKSELVIFIWDLLVLFLAHLSQLRWQNCVISCIFCYMWVLEWGEIRRKAMKEQGKLIFL